MTATVKTQQLSPVVTDDDGSRVGDEAPAVIPIPKPRRGRPEGSKNKPPSPERVLDYLQDNRALISPREALEALVGKETADQVVMMKVDPTMKVVFYLGVGLAGLGAITLLRKVGSVFSSSPPSQLEEVVVESIPMSPVSV